MFLNNLGIWPRDNHFQSKSLDMVVAAIAYAILVAVAEAVTTSANVPSTEAYATVMGEM